MLDLDKVQFKHDNRIDYLTRSDAPIIFYKNLMRAMTTRKRNGGALYIVTIKILTPSKSYRKGSTAEKRQIAEFEESLIKSSELIKKNLRSQDSFTRMAIDGFYVLISGERSDESKLVERFKRLFADRAKYEVKGNRLTGDLSPKEWLDQVDQLFFSSSTLK